MPGVTSEQALKNYIIRCYHGALNGSSSSEADLLRLPPNGEGERRGGGNSASFAISSTYLRKLQLNLIRMMIYLVV